MDGKLRTVEEVLAGLAGGSQGIVTRREMLRAGITRIEVDRRVGKGLLIRQYRGVYRVGHAAPMRLTWLL